MRHFHLEASVGLVLSGAAHLAQELAELLADEAVHEEVRRRVDRQQHVGDGVDVAQRRQV